MQGISGNLSNPKPGYTTGGMVRGGPKQSGEAGRDWAGPDAKGRFAKDTTVPRAPQCIEDNCAERPLGSTNKRKAYLNRWRNTMRG